MVDPDVLLDTLVEALKTITALTALVPAESITAYHHDYPGSTSYLKAVSEMQPPEIIVAHRETQISRRIDHIYLATIRPNHKPGPVFQAIREGVIPSTGLKFKLSQISFDCDPPRVQRYAGRSLFITDQTSIDYHEIEIVLSERGIDN